MLAVVTAWLQFPNFGPLGIVLTDQAYEILQCRIRRLDLISPRPLGSASFTPYATSGSMRTMRAATARSQPFMYYDPVLADRAVLSLHRTGICGSIIVSYRRAGS